jgi:hypothetical protein
MDTFQEITRLRRKKTKRKVSKMSLLELFIDVDDFWQVFSPIWQQQLLADGCI